MHLQAVLTGDIVNSTKLTSVNEKRILKQLKSILLAGKHEFYRGDSFQVYIKDASQALRIALLCRMAAMAIPPDENGTRSDVRISIGIGSVKMPVKTLSAAKGDAFIFSGRAFDELTKTGKRLIIVTYNSIAKTAFEIISDYVNSVLENITDKQATVILKLLSGHSQKKVANTLQKSKSTISQHVTSGRFYEIERLLEQYANIVKQMK
jgi:hypothetical protein